VDANLRKLAVTKWKGINEHFIKHIVINYLMLYFFSAPLKRVVGVCGLGGEALAKNTASHPDFREVLRYWILNIMFL
jgi:hypothetical protein